MSTKEFENYMNLYSQFLYEIVNFHNAHMNFARNKGRATKYDIRRVIKRIIKLQQEIYKSTKQVHEESLENHRLQIVEKKIQAEYRKANPLKRGRKKKNSNVDISRKTS